MSHLLWFGMGRASLAVTFLALVSIKGFRAGLLLLAALLCWADSSEACQRCGIFGRGCRFASYSYYTPAYYQPVTYAAPATTQNFVFNNSYPVAALPSALLSPGNSVYGYSLAAQAYNVDAAQVLDRAGRLAELAFTSGQKAVDGFNDTAGNALALSAEANRQQQNTLLALSAIQANTTSQPAQSLSFRATVTNGKLALERIEAAPAAACADGNCPPAAPRDGHLPRADPGNGTLSLSAGSAVAQYCGRCHDGTGKHKTPQGLSLDGQTQITAQQFERSTLRIMNGEMPPPDSLASGQPLSIELQARIVKELAKLAP